MKRAQLHGLLKHGRCEYGIFLGFDWFTGTAILLCAGNIER
jgi:hypothetical protein